MAEGDFQLLLYVLCQVRPQLNEENKRTWFGKCLGHTCCKLHTDVYSKDEVWLTVRESFCFSNYLFPVSYSHTLVAHIKGWKGCVHHIVTYKVI